VSSVDVAKAKKNSHQEETKVAPANPCQASQSNSSTNPQLVDQCTKFLNNLLRKFDQGSANAQAILDQQMDERGISFTPPAPITGRKRERSSPKVPLPHDDIEDEFLPEGGEEVEEKEEGKLR